MTRTAAELIEEALTHLTLAESYAQRDLTEQVTTDAICMRLAAAIETLARLDDAQRQRLFGSTWPSMWGMRNRIAHGYLLIDHGIIQSTVERDLPLLLDILLSDAAAD